MTLFFYFQKVARLPQKERKTDTSSGEFRIATSLCNLMAEILPLKILYKQDDESQKDAGEEKKVSQVVLMTSSPAMLPLATSTWFIISQVEVHRNNLQFYQMKITCLFLTRDD